MKINLLPDLVLTRRKEARIKQIALMSLAGWAGVLLVVTLITLGYKVGEDHNKDTQTKAEAALDSKVNSPANKAFRSQAAEVQASLTALDQLFNHQQRMSKIDTRIAELTPKTVQLNTVQIAPDGTVHISASAPSYFDAGQMVAALKGTTQSHTSEDIYFKDVALGGANLGDNKVAFSVTASFVYPDPTVTAENGGGKS